MKVGFIGLGLMGAPMAANLARGGHQLFLFDVVRIPADLVAAGGVACASSGEVAGRADVVITMVPKTADVEQILFSPGGVSENLSPGKLVIDMSSSAPFETRKFAKRIGKIGCEYLDAPVSGGDVGAREGSLTIMVGGTDRAFERARPLFALMGRNITHVGASGDGHATKLANAIIVGGTMTAVAEALHVVKLSGASPAAVRAALKGGFADSRVLDLHGKRMAERNFVPGGPARFQLKDMRTAEDFAEKAGAHLTILPKLIEMYTELIERQGDALDVSAILLEVERRTRESTK